MYFKQTSVTLISSIIFALSFHAPVYAQNKGSVLGSMESWCKQQTAVLGNKKMDPAAIAVLINEEFNVKEMLSLQDAFIQSLNKPSESKAYVGAAYWRSTFESVKVRTLYDSFLAFPEPEILAVIIDLSKKSGDAQIKNDARMALAFLHLSSPQISIKPDRWSELVKQAGSEHWTALTFRARLAAYGELGTKQEIRTAMGLLTQAGNKKMEYLQSRGRFEWDKNNYEVPYNHLAFAVTKGMPGQFPAFESFNETFQKIEIAQRNYYSRYPTTRAGKLGQTAHKFNEESAALGKKVVELSQNANALQGTLASYESLTAVKKGDKETFGNVDPQSEAMLLTMYQQLGDLAPEQTKLLEQAQQKRYAAQGLIAEMQSDLASQLFGGSGQQNQGGEQDDLMVRAAMLTPAMAEAQNALIRSCVFAAKWEQAMRAKNVAVPDKKKVADDLSKSVEFK